MTFHTWDVQKEKLKAAAFALRDFLRNPVRGIRDLQDFDWPTLLLGQACFAAGAASLKNVIQRDVFGLFTDIIAAPISAVVVAATVSGALFGLGKFVFKKDMEPRRLYTIVVFASFIPQLINVPAHFLPALNLAGVAIALYLIFVGLSHHERLESRKLGRIFAGLFALLVLTWAIQFVRHFSRQESMRQKASPESLDILEKEFNPEQ